MLRTSIFQFNLILKAVNLSVKKKQEKNFYRTVHRTNQNAKIVYTILFIFSVGICCDSSQTENPVSVILRVIQGFWYKMKFAVFFLLLINPKFIQTIFD